MAAAPAPCAARRGRIAPVQFSRRSSIVAAEIRGRPFAVRDDPCRGGPERRALAPRRLRNLESIGRRGMGEPHVADQAMYLVGQRRKFFRTRELELANESD